MDESRCLLKGITEKNFTVHTGDGIECENRQNEAIARVRVKSVSFSSAANNPKDSDIVDIQAGCATDFVIEFDIEFYSVNFKEKYLRERLLSANGRE